MRAHLERIEAVNPALNAIVTLVPDRALADAAAADRALAAGEAPGPLHGLPIAIKDLEDVAGVRTTYGSPLYAEHVPDADSGLTVRLRRAGAIVVGKTNTPEFGAGSQTFNPVFGATHNPHDRSRTSGGSSGGAAAAVAAHLLPLADGSDYGGSIRNPAAFCGIVGLRPSPGRIPEPEGDPWNPFPTYGPLARSAADAALFMAAVSGPDPAAPLSLGPGADFARPLPDPPARPRIAWSRDLGGLPVEPEVTAALEPWRAAMADRGWEVEKAEPDLAGADEAFEVLRALGFAEAFGPLLESGGLKATIVENARAGFALDGARVAAALAARAEAFHAMRAFLARYDALALPVAQVVPFGVEVEWPRAVAGVPMGSYLEWMRACTRITVTGHPAVAVPGARTPDGLPVGLQLVGRHGGERELLALAAALEGARLLS